MDSQEQAVGRIEQIRSHLQVTGSKPIQSLAGQVAIITGGARGIGRAAAFLLAADGARVVISDIDAVESNKTVEELATRGYQAASIPGNLLDHNFPEHLVQEVLRKYGQVNCLINNAGFSNDSAIHKMDEKQFDVVMKIHNYVPYRLIKALSKSWMDSQNHDMPKCIVNISSTSGLHGSMGQINYATAKAGVTGLTKTVAAEWGRYNVRCNCVAFGWIDTRMTRPPSESETIKLGDRELKPGIPMSAKRWRDVSDIPLGRMGTEEEAAGAIWFLTSPFASYVTGTCLECTGGRFM